MQPVRYSINVTLDGCCDHRVGIADEELHQNAAENIARAECLLFGRITYKMMEDGWRALAETGKREDWMADWMQPFAKTIHAAKKYVVTDTLTHVDWNSEIVRSADLEQTVRKLKEQPGKGIFIGGVSMPVTLAKLGLIDEYEFIVHPRVAGHGPRLLDGIDKLLDLELVGRKEFGSGAVSLQYRNRQS